jgi:hypothetical protein
MEKLPQSVLEFVLCRFLYPWEVHQVSQNHFCRRTEHVLFGLKEWKWPDNMFFKRVRQGFIRMFRVDHNFNPEHVSVPKSVTHLTFGRGFKQPLVEDSIPESVTHMKFGCRITIHHSFLGFLTWWLYTRTGNLMSTGCRVFQSPKTIEGSDCYSDRTCQELALNRTLQSCNPRESLRF